MGCRARRGREHWFIRSLIVLSQAVDCWIEQGRGMRLFIGDDWAEDHHDVELMDERGKPLAKARLPEGVAGIATLHKLVAEQLGETADDDQAEVVVGIETDRGPW